MKNRNNLFPIEQTERGDEGVAIFVQDQTTRILDIPFLIERSNSATLASVGVIGSRVITVNPGHSLQVGSIIEVADDKGQFFQARILTVAVNTITLDTPLNSPYKVGSQVLESSDAMLVDGSVTPKVFSILPLPSQAGDIVRIILAITGTTAQDFETFGSAPALTNGCVVRVKRENGEFENIFNWKTNGQFIERAFDYAYQVNNGGGVRSFSARRTFAGQSKNGVVVRLEGSRNEELQVVIQDNLTGTTNTSFRMYAQGHELQ